LFGEGFEEPPNIDTRESEGETSFTHVQAVSVLEHDVGQQYQPTNKKGAGKHIFLYKMVVKHRGKDTWQCQKNGGRLYHQRLRHEKTTVGVQAVYTKRAGQNVVEISVDPFHVSGIIKRSKNHVHDGVHDIQFGATLLKRPTYGITCPCFTDGRPRQTQRGDKGTHAL